MYQKLYGLQAWQSTPIQYLHELGFQGPEGTCGHSVWVTDDGIEVRSNTGTHVCRPDLWIAGNLQMSESKAVGTSSRVLKNP